MSSNDGVLKSRTLDVFERSNERLAYEMKVRDVPTRLLQQILDQPDEELFRDGYNVSEQAYGKLKKYIEGSPEVDFTKYDVQIAYYDEDNI